MRTPAPAAALMLSALFSATAGPADASDLTDLMHKEEAARPGPTADGADQGVGSSTTRSLRPEANSPTPHVGPGEDRRVPIPQALDMLREAQGGVRALQQAAETPPQGDPKATPLARDGQQILLQAQHAVQAVQHSGAVPTDSQEVRDSLLSITKSLNALHQEPAQAADLLATVQDDLDALQSSAEQATLVPRQAP